MILMMNNGEKTLFNFSKATDLSKWMIVDDVVMGGRSNGQLYISNNGIGVFEGKVSTENYGGFSSIRLDCESMEVEGYTTAILKVKGDGKSYQFRSKSSIYDRHSYVRSFKTSGDWEMIEISLSDMEPRFRGRNLDMPNYPAKKLSEIALLIGNKKNESFKLEIESIVLK